MLRHILAVGIAATAFASAAHAADLIIEEPAAVVEAIGFDWEGFYIGAQAGGQWYPDPDISYGLLGVHAGYNFLASESFLLGIEGTAEVITGDFGTYGEFFVNGRVGALVSDAFLLYGIGGVGVEVAEDGDTFGTYQLGAGLEAAVTDSVSVRGQLVGVGFFDDDELFPGVKATVGVSFHF